MSREMMASERDAVVVRVEIPSRALADGLILGGLATKVVEKKDESPRPLGSWGCPKCGCDASSVKDSRPRIDTIWRRRACDRCKQHYITNEFVVGVPDARPTHAKRAASEAGLALVEQAKQQHESRANVRDRVELEDATNFKDRLKARRGARRKQAGDDYLTSKD